MTDAERDALQQELLLTTKLTDPSTRVILQTHVGAHVFAWISLFCFIFGGAFLLFRHGV